MKLVIEIDDELYTVLKALEEAEMATAVDEIIINGTPFNDCIEEILAKIRVEIESMDFDFGDYYDNTNEIIEMVCKVVDKYIDKENN